MRSHAGTWLAVVACRGRCRAPAGTGTEVGVGEVGRTSVVGQTGEETQVCQGSLSLCQTPLLVGLLCSL